MRILQKNHKDSAQEAEKQEEEEQEKKKKNSKQKQLVKLSFFIFTTQRCSQLSVSAL